MLLSCMPYLTAAAEGETAAVFNLKISDEAGLEAFRDAVNNGTSYAGYTVSLERNITLTELNWTPIGDFSGSKPFMGTFNGKGHTISNLSITSGDYVGLFGYVSGGGTIKNLNVSGQISASGNAGGIVAYLNESKSTVSCCHSDVKISGTGETSSAVGGIVGMNANGRVDNCYNTAQITAKYNVGGIIGYSSLGVVQYCHDRGDVKTSVATQAYGAIIGSTNNDDVTSCRYLSGVCAYGMGGTESGTVQSAEVKALGTGEYKDAANFQYWDFTDTWEMGSSYPVLKYNPYKGFSDHIKNTEQLEMLRDAVNSHNPVEKYDTYYLDNDLDMSKISDWEPIGVSGDPFKKTFTGWDPVNNIKTVRTITGLKINSTNYSNYGLFGCNDGGTIKNLKLDSFAITAGSYAGCLIGQNNQGSLENITVTNSSVNGTGGVGGVVGYDRDGKLNHITVSSTSISSTGDDAGDDAGGVVGHAFGATAINDVIITSNTAITGNGHVGGIINDNVGSIKNASISDCTITGNNSYTGGVAGINDMAGTMESISFSNVKVTGKGNTGGLVGSSYNAMNGKNAVISGITVSGTNNVGGIVGSTDYDISNYSINSSIVTGGDANTAAAVNVGGIAGNTTAEISNCKTLSGTEVYGYGPHIGGIVGLTSNNITSCENNASVKCKKATLTSVADHVGDIGGIAGLATGGTISGCRSLSDINGIDIGGVNVGGIAGRLEGSAVVEKCYNTRSVYSAYNKFNVGGVVGSVDSENAIVRNCYNTGDVMTNGVLGGIAGVNNGTVQNCYSKGQIKVFGGGYYNDCGVVGTNDGNIKSCYFLENTAPRVASGGGSIDTDSRALSESELSDETNFKGWDFNDSSIWTIDCSMRAPVFFDLKLTRDDEDIETGYYTDANGKLHDDATAFIVTLTCGDVAATPYVRSSITAGGQTVTYEEQLKTQISGKGYVNIGIVLTGIAADDAVLKAQAMIE